MRERRDLSMYISLLGVLTLIVNLGVRAQEPIAERRISKDSVEVGDSILLTFKVQTRKGAEIYLPELTDTIGGGFEIYSPPYLDTLQYNDSGYVAEWHLPIVTYDTGWRVVPDLPLLVMYNGRSDTLTTGVTLIHVSFVPLDESLGELAPLRDPLAQRITFRELFPWLLGGLGIVLVGLGVYLWLRYRKRGIPFFAATPKDNRPPEEIALSILQTLTMQEVWRREGMKVYYTGITDALRGYLEAIWRMRTLEETTAEIVRALEDISACSLQHRREIQELLERADFVKFARYEPLETEARSDGMLAIRLVEEIAALMVEMQAEKQKRESVVEEKKCEQSSNSEKEV